MSYSKYNISRVFFVFTSACVKTAPFKFILSLPPSWEVSKAEISSSNWLVTAVRAEGLNGLPQVHAGGPSDRGKKEKPGFPEFSPHLQDCVPQTWEDQWETYQVSAPKAGVQVGKTELGWGTMSTLMGRWKQLEANLVSGHAGFIEKEIFRNLLNCVRGLTYYVARWGKRGLKL